MPAFHCFEQQVADAWAPSRWGGVAVVVAVSGGADSVALLRALAKLQPEGPGRLVVAHFNHRWRADASDADEQFVRQLSAQLGLPCEVGETAAGPEGAVQRREVDARSDRYRFFRSLSDRLGARYVATAHTADDRAETILHRIVRGTGLVGLAGIPRTRSLSRLTTIVRPMLAISRDQTRQYLRDLGQSFQEDASNHSLRYTRNRIRRELIPQLQRHYNARVVQALLRLGDLAGDAQQEVGQLVDALRRQCVTSQSPSRVCVHLAGLQTQSPYLVREVLIAIWREQGWPERAMDGAKWSSLCDLVLAPREAWQCLMLPGAIEARIVGPSLELAGP